MKRNLVCILKGLALLSFFLFVFYYFLIKDDYVFENDSDDQANDQNFDFILHDFTPHYVQNKAKILEYENELGEEYFKVRNISTPLIIWWTPFTMDTGSYKTCGAQKKTCFFTNSRQYKKNIQTPVKAYLFYGTDFYLHDLPLPRQSDEEWALLHEESPKNNYLFSFKKIMEMFNHTATFKRQSDLTLLTQYLTSIEDIESNQFVVSTQVKNKLQTEEGLAPIAYIQSDCVCPSDRDIFVKELMKHIKVDSYGLCLHNKDLPQSINEPVKGMFSDEFYNLIAKYKFVLSMENSVCEDYVTEKLWRSFYTGTVPIVYGSSKVSDLFPTNKSAIEIVHFGGPKALAEFIHKVNKNDSQYEEYLTYKKKNGVTNTFLISLMTNRTWEINNDPVKGNYIEKLECLVCERIHENIELNKIHLPTVKHQATKEHYGCPLEKTFSDSGILIDENYEMERKGWRQNSFQFMYDMAWSLQEAFFNDFLADAVYNFTAEQLQNKAMKFYHALSRSGQQTIEL